MPEPMPLSRLHARSKKKLSKPNPTTVRHYVRLRCLTPLSRRKNERCAKPTGGGTLSDREGCVPGRRDGEVFGADRSLGWRERSRMRTIGDRHSQTGRSQLWPVETDAVLGLA